MSAPRRGSSPWAEASAAPEKKVRGGGGEAEPQRHARLCASVGGPEGEEGVQERRFKGKVAKNGGRRAGVFGLSGFCRRVQ
jgi:hypothetical protein